MIPTVADIRKENPNRAKEFVDAGLKVFAEEHLFKYNRTPKPGDKYVLHSWSFMNKDALTQELQKEVIQELSCKLTLLGYKVTEGEYLHNNIYGQTYAKSPKLIIEVPLRDDSNES